MLILATIFSLLFLMDNNKPFSGKYKVINYSGCKLTWSCCGITWHSSDVTINWFRNKSSVNQLLKLWQYRFLRVLRKWKKRDYSHWKNLRFSHIPSLAATVMPLPKTRLVTASFTVIFSTTRASSVQLMSLILFEAQDKKSEQAA